MGIFIGSHFKRDLERSFGKDGFWTSVCGLSVYPTQNGLMLFNINAKILGFQLPPLNGQNCHKLPALKYWSDLEYNATIKT